MTESTGINEMASDAMTSVPTQEPRPPPSLEAPSEEDILINLPGTEEEEASEEAQECSTPRVELRRSGGSERGSETLEQPGESSELLDVDHDPGSSQTVDRGRSKWVKLRSTIKATVAFAPSSHRRQRLERQDSFLKRFSTRQGGSQYAEESVGGQEPEVLQSKETEEKSTERIVINPDETFMFAWLSGVTCAVLYNLWTCIAREAFPEIRMGFEALWFTADALCDLVYLLDIVVQLRTGYLERGLIVYETLKLVKHYVYSRCFVLDLVSLLPLDLIQIYVGVHPLLRFPRFIKAYRLGRFVYMVETRTAFPNMWRVANLSHVLFLGCHWFAAFYFLISKAEQFGTGWSYPPPSGEYASVTQKYLRSLYWSTLTLTTIGDLPSPESNWEFVFTITSYLIGVFVFATIVGQVGNVITNQNASRQEFERHLDGAKSYMRYHNVPRAMQQRVQRWYDYAWSRGRINGGGDINSLGLLPDKLKTELALHVNLETLKKVAIFHKCEPEFLHDLVLKMKPYIFTPRDLICRKGEVAREMFIIADGLVEVVSDSGEVLKQMGAGDFFGEIGILNLDGGVNRRTVDVRSLGYSELFVLSRDDVLEAFRDHPEAEVLIREYGQSRLRELDEHKKRRLCERLAKELSTSSTEAGASTVGKMVLSTGLIHGIGMAASSGPPERLKDKKPDDSSHGVMSKSNDLPNGNSRSFRGQGEDRWTNLLKMAVKGPDGCRSAASLKSGRAHPEAKTSGRASQERKLLPVSRRRHGKTEVDTAEASETSSSRQEVIIIGGKVKKTVDEVSDPTITRRLVGIFTKKKSNHPKPRKLWSLGGGGRGATVTTSVHPPSAHAKPTDDACTDDRDVTNRINNAQIEEANGSILTHAQCSLARMESSGAAQSGVELNSNNKFQTKSNNCDDSKSGDVIKTVEGFSDVASSLRSTAPMKSSTSGVDASPGGTRSTVAASAFGDFGSETKSLDFQTLCSNLSDTIRDFVHRELMTIQEDFRDRLRTLEEEISQKETTIARLRKQLQSQNNNNRNNVV